MTEAFREPLALTRTSSSQLEPPTPSSLSRLVSGSLTSSITALTNDLPQTCFPGASDWFGVDTTETEGDPKSAATTEQSSVPLAPPSSVTPDQKKSEPDISLEHLTQRLLSASENGGRFVPAVPPANHVVKNGVRLTSTGKPSHARKVAGDHIKRPRNPFILFRSHACMSGLIPQELGITDHRHISRIIGSLWKALGPEDKEVWESMAEKEKEEHRRQNPDYKYKPKQRNESSKRRRKKEQQDQEVEEEERKCEVVAKVLLEGGDVDEERLQREIEEQREKDLEEGRERAVKHRKKRARAERSSSEGRSFTPEPRGASVDDFLHPSAAGDYRDGSMESFIEASNPSLHRPSYSRHSEPIGHNDFDLFNLVNLSRNQAYPLPPITPRSQYGYSSFNDSYLSSALGVSGLSPFRGTNFPSPANRESFDGSSSQDLLRRIHTDSQSDLQWPQSARSQSVPVEQPSWSSHNYDARQLRHLLNDEPSPQPVSSLGPAATSRSVNHDHLERSYTLQPEQEVQYVYLTREQATDTELVESIRRSGFGITFDADVPAAQSPQRGSPVDIVL